MSLAQGVFYMRSLTVDPHAHDLTEVKRVILAEPRGFCAGVKRAIAMVERALQLYGSPVYVRREIVHNRYVVDALAAKGAVFVESEDEVPPGSVCLFSAHGVSPAVRANAESRELTIIDAACPLVSTPATRCAWSTSRANWASARIWCPTCPAWRSGGSTG